MPYKKNRERESEKKRERLRTVARYMADQLPDDGDGDSEVDRFVRWANEKLISINRICNDPRIYTQKNGG